MQLSRSATKKCVTTTVFILGIVTIATLPIRAQNNDAPVAHASAVTTTAGIAVDGVLQASDPESGQLTFAIVTAPENGSAVITDVATGAFTYTPAPGFAGYDAFTFSVTDGASTSTATAMMFVVAVDAGMTSTVERVSVSSSGQQGNGMSSSPGISADGRIVVFRSEATNLVDGDTNGLTDVFVRDRQTQTTIRVNVASDGSQSSAGTGAGWVSADGRFVGFASAAALTPDDANGLVDIFIHDLQTRETTRVRPAPDGAEANSSVWTMWGLSGDGRDVLFTSDASNLVPDDTNGQADLFVHDRQTGTTTRLNPAGIAASTARMTPDGRHVSFNGGDYAYLHDRRTGQTVYEGLAYVGGQSVDGRYVAFHTWEPLMGETNNDVDAFVRDRHTGAITRAGVNSLGTLGNQSSVVSTMSADGRFVWLSSRSTNLDPVDPDTFMNEFRRDLRYQDTKFVSLRNGGNAQGPWGSRPGGTVTGATADGRTLVAYSWESNMVSADWNGVWDVFVISSVPYPAADAWDYTFTQMEDIGMWGLMQAPHPRRLPVTYSFLSQPALGALSMLDAARGEFQYIPPPDFDGTVSFTFKATTSDGIDSDVGTATVRTTPVNDAPRITSHTVSTASPVIGDEVRVTVAWHDIDGGGPFTGHVFWGDGSAEEIVTDVSTTHTFVHRYARIGTQQALFYIADATHRSAWLPVPITVMLRTPTSYLRFNAAEADRVTVSSSGNVAAGPITVAAWLRTTASGVDMVALSKGAVLGEQWKLHRGSDNRVFFTIGGTTTLVGAQSAVNQGSDGAWHHYVGVWDGTTVRLYIDGYQTNTVARSQTQAMRVSADPICIGSSSSKAKCGSKPWSGDIGTAGVWNRALTADEIAALSRGEAFPGQALQRAAFWQINEGTGQKLEDAGTSNRDGLLGATTKVEAFDPTWGSGN
jgi:hypothetical protein